MKAHFTAAVFAATLASATAAQAGDWNGWYAGVNAGYLWSNSDTIDTSSVPGPCNPASGGGCTAVPNYSTLFATGATGSVLAELNGFSGGAQLGFNSQMTNWVWGIETDIQSGPGSSSGTYTVVTPSPAFPAQPATTTFTGTRTLDFIGTLRARLGFLTSPNTLLYATAGLAYGGADMDATYVATCTGCSWTLQPNGSFSDSDTLTGYTVGGGLEFAFAPNWTFKTEYLYYDLGDMSVGGLIQGTNSGTGFLFASHTTTATTDFDGHLVRVGVNFRF